MPRPAAVSLGFVDFSEIFEKFSALAEANCLWVSAAERGSGLCMTWTGWVLKQSSGKGEFDGD